MNQYYKWNDGWFDYYINRDTGEKKFKLEDGDIEIDHPKLDDFVIVFDLIGGDFR